MAADPLQQWPVPKPGERPIVTPGPWGMAPETNGTEFVAYSANPWRVRAVLFRGDFFQNPNWRADTKAMSAVSDLIEALEEVREHCSERADAECDAGSADWTGNAEMRLLMTVEAALRKAGVL